MELRVQLNRFEDTVREYESRPVETGGLLLYGSSFFTNWGYERAARHLEGVCDNTVCHGIGGGTVDELLYYYGRLVYPYKPAAIVLRTGANDLFHDYTPAEAADLTVRLCEWARTDFPRVRIIVLPIFDFPSAPSRPKHKLFAPYNMLLKAYADRTPGVDYLDIGQYLYTDPAYIGTFDHFRDVFGPDGLHLTDAGYEAFAPWFRDTLKQILSEVPA
ncbi:MAG: hypothetical protein GX929_09405 [Clostridiales bacterium]|jgi:lysophospholipase L1-like esterase|nr:hypothetical protein [Clostridiales bacterium]